MFGMNLVVFAGFAVSVHTLWISNKISEGGNVCSSATVFSCDDVLGNAQYNTDPVFNIPWGMIGIFAFCGLMFITNCVSKEPDALWAENYLKYGKYMTALGLPIIALLISYEVAMEKICQFCTMAHIANVVCLFGFWRAGKMHEEGLWNDEEPVEADADKEEGKKFW
ncbi:MAG TPA: vitamin K epoxide reductase family protein [Candidatus Poseidoniales archaeon]|nr:MAG TPA: vitamin K epoxide reductase family protein [Candidatus Poseidoniales archaeon]